MASTERRTSEPTMRAVELQEENHALRKRVRELEQYRAAVYEQWIETQHQRDELRARLAELESRVPDERRFHG